MSYYTDKQKSKWENENKILVPYGIYYCDDDTYEWCNEDGIEVGDLHKEQRQYDSDYVEFTPYDIIYRIQKECDFIPYSFRMNNDFVENM